MRRTAFVVVAATLALAGCSGGGDAGSQSSGDSLAHEAAGEAAAPDEAGGDARDAGADDSGGVIGQAALTAPQRSIIYTVDLTVRTDDVDQATEDAATVATDAGGFVADETADGDSATLRLRIPADVHTDAVGRLEDLGDVTHRSRSTEDVTQEVVDTESRISSQRASIARIRELLDRATKLSDVVTIESELARREADLDALLSRQEQLDGLTSLATITVSFESTADAGDDDDAGFLSGLGGGWDAFVTAGSVALTVLGALVPFAVLGALVGTPVYVIVRRRRGGTQAESA